MPVTDAGHGTSAVVVAVPEAEESVGGLRAELDPSAGRGVPAHVTVMIPFVRPVEIDDEVLAALRATVARTPAFPVTFERVCWFGDDTFWLAPEPDGPFVALTRSVRSRFALAPYGGAFGDDVVPHLTVGHGAPLPRMRAAAERLRSAAAVRAHIGSAQLMVNSHPGGRWTTAAHLPLGSS